MKRVAFCLRGAVTKYKKKGLKLGDIYSESEPYVNFKAVHYSIQKHIINSNPNYHFDIFIQSWNPDLLDEMNDLYKPVSSLYENNNDYKDDISSKCGEGVIFAGVSQCLAIKKALGLVEDYEINKNITYDMVILYRPDVLLWKDMKLDEYDTKNKMYVNAHIFGNGDLHFIMSSSQARKFKGIYDWLSIINKYYPHNTIKHYITKILNIPLEPDSIYPLFNQDVIRLIHPYKLRQLMSYGITDSDIKNTCINYGDLHIYIYAYLIIISMYSLIRYHTLKNKVYLMFILMIPLLFIIYYNYGPYIFFISFIIFPILILSSVRA